MKNETTVTEQPCTLHIVVCCADFTKQDWYSFAGRIDNNFFYDFEKFTADGIKYMTDNQINDFKFNNNQLNFNQL